jgi:predicted deacetylase
VVPDYHRSNPIAEDPAFLGWLRQLEAEGHEVVIHGYFHTRPRAAHEGMMARLITRSYTQDEGEFYDLDYEEALRRIKAAYEIFAAARLKPRGFIAPAWLLNREGERAARDAGMEYTTRLGTVTDLRNGRQYRARSMVYSVRNQWRRAASLAWNGALFAMTRQAPLVRLSLHPPDFSCPGVWRQIEKFVVALAKTRTATTYQEWIAEERVRTSDDT